MNDFIITLLKVPTVKIMSLKIFCLQCDIK